VAIRSGNTAGGAPPGDQRPPRRGRAGGLPLCTTHVSAEEWDAFGQRALAAIPRRHLPIVLGWVSGEASPEQWESVHQMLPRLVRVLFTMFWAPAYAKRRRRLYRQPPAVAEI
jgi:hypothetical protein